MTTFSLRALVPAVGTAALSLAACASGAPADADVEREELAGLQAATSAASEAFAGMTIDEELGVATVFVAGKRQAEAMQRLDPYLNEGIFGPDGRYSLEYRMVPRSQAELDEVQAAITRDHSWIDRAGGELLEWGVDTDRNVVEVGVAELTPELAAAALEQFGGAVELFEAERSQMMSRVNDTSPFYSGIALFDSSNAACTAGWAIQKISNPTELAMTTAGHCYPAGRNVVNWDDSIGTMVWPIWEENGLDIGYITGRHYEATTYVGPFNSNTSKAIRNSAATVVGMNVCANGSATGEVCGAKVTHRNRCVRMHKPETGESRNTCSLARMEKSQVFLAVGGDSGGGVHVKVSTGVQAVGSIVGGARADEVFFHEMRSIIPVDWRLRTR